MLIHVGNANAIEPTTGPDGQQEWTSYDGERVTTFRIDDATSAGDAAAIVISTLPHMMNQSATPWWIECDDNLMVRDILLNHFGLAADTVRPQEWGDGTTTAKKTKTVRAAKKKTTPKEES